MLKIVDIHTAAGARGEYVVLQNQGLVTVSLRGWALCTDAYLYGEAAQVAAEMYIFRDDIPIKPYTQVVLFTGEGTDGWQPTVDGRQAYCAYWGRNRRVWTDALHIHVLQMSASRRIAAPAVTAPTAHADAQAAFP
jgi:hypothetical protein